MCIQRYAATFQEDHAGAGLREALWDGTWRAGWAMHDSWAWHDVSTCRAAVVDPWQQHRTSLLILLLLLLVPALIQRPIIPLLLRLVIPGGACWAEHTRGAFSGGGNVPSGSEPPVPCWCSPCTAMVALRRWHTGG
jgi:hypothetical protein